MMTKCFRCGKRVDDSEIYNLCLCDELQELERFEKLSYEYPVCKDCKNEAIDRFEVFMD